MKSPELLEATASEPLSFEEELEMQRMYPWKAGCSFADDEMALVVGREMASR